MSAYVPRHAFDVHAKPQPSLVTLFFRRVIAAARRKAVPARFPRAGTETALLAAPVTVLPRPDGDVVIDERGSVRVRPVNGRSLGTLPRRKPLVDRPPWQTAEMPAYPNGWQ